MLILLSLACIALVTGWLTARLRTYALSRGLVDVPGERSLHRRPTPRGGGAAIALVALAMLLVLGLSGYVDSRVALVLVVGGAPVAGIGILDDHGHVSPFLRLLVHFAASSWVIAMLYPMPPLTLAGVSVAFGWLSVALGVLWLAWLINLYNFMDGIDGLAGLEAVTVSFSTAALLYLANQQNQFLVLAIVGSASVGFLIWNWPPARVHMGDAGSGFLGFVFGAMALISHATGALEFWVWPILLGVFIVDATVTLLRRVARLEKFYEAHRSHAYQHAARELGAHMPVTVFVACINLLWLLPISALVSRGIIQGELGVLIAYSPLLWLAYKFKAGDTHYQPEIGG